MTKPSLEEIISFVNPILLIVFQTFSKDTDEDKIINALESPCSHTKREATINLVIVIKRNAFDC